MNQEQLRRRPAALAGGLDLAVGFSSAKYFSRLFRQTFGHAPSDEVRADLP